MLGPDLDGDKFEVTWDKRLFLKDWSGCVKARDGSCRSSTGDRITMKRASCNASILARVNARAMDCEAPPVSAPVHFRHALSSDEALTAALLRHFLDHIKLASVGRICMLWLDCVAVNGATCDECLQLAKLHSDAVDCPKSGIPVSTPDHLAWSSSDPRPHLL